MGWGGWKGVVWMLCRGRGSRTYKLPIISRMSLPPDLGDIFLRSYVALYFL